MGTVPHRFITLVWRGTVPSENKEWYQTKYGIQIGGDVLIEGDVLFKSGANAMKKFEGVGGILYLTNEALYHKPHKLNIQSRETLLPFSTIKRFEAKKYYLLFRNLL